jgi:hypothetical protein
VEPGTDYRDVRVDYLLATGLGSAEPAGEPESGEEPET